MHSQRAEFVVSSSLVPHHAVTSNEFTDAAMLVSEVDGVAVVKFFSTAAGAERELEHVLSKTLATGHTSQHTRVAPQLKALVRASWSATVSLDGTTAFRLMKILMAI